MDCPFCNRKIVAKAVFCPYCGDRIKGENTDQKFELLLEEFKHLAHLRERGGDQTTEFSKFYMLASASIIAIVAISVDLVRLDILMFFLTLALFFIGFVTYNYVIDHHLSITNYTIKLNRKRDELESLFGEPKNEFVDPIRGKVGFEKQSIFLAGYSGVIGFLSSLSLTACSYFLIHGLHDKRIWIISIGNIVTVSIIIGIVYFVAMICFSLKKFKSTTNI